MSREHPTAVHAIDLSDDLACIQIALSRSDISWEMDVDVAPNEIWP
jgi:hypothetical protein